MPPAAPGIRKRQLRFRKETQMTAQETPGESKAPLRIFSARACAAPLEKAAKLFESQTGIDVEISVCSRHCAEPVAEEATGTTGGDDFLLEIADAGIHDLAIGGAEYLLDDGEIRGIVQRGQRRTIACRRSAILVPAGNPKNIRSVEDMAKPGVRVAVSVLDCLKGLWEDITARLGLLDGVRRNITFYANGCIAIVEAVAEGTVDAAFGWTAFEHLAPGRIEIIEMPEEQQLLRATGVGLLAFSKRPRAAMQFMDFYKCQAVGCLICDFLFQVIQIRPITAEIRPHDLSRVVLNTEDKPSGLVSFQTGFVAERRKILTQFIKMKRSSRFLEFKPFGFSRQGHQLAKFSVQRLGVKGLHPSSFLLHPSSFILFASGVAARFSSRLK